MRKSGLPRLSGKDGKEGVPKRSLLPPPRAGRPPSQGVANVVSPTDQPDVTEFGSKSQLIVGDRVTICGVKLGVVRYIGSTRFGEGEWCGIELDEAEGKHDGETEGMRYFTCSPNHGIFAPSHKVLLVSPDTDISPASSDSTLKERSPSPEKSSRLPQPKGRARSNSPEHSQESSQPPQKIKKTSNLKEPSKLPPTRPRSAEYGVEEGDPVECSTSQPGKSRSIKPPQTGLPKPGFIRPQRSSVSDDKCNNNNVDDSIHVRPSKPSSLPGPKTSTAVKGKGQRMFDPNDTYEIDCQEFDSDFPPVTSPSRVDTHTALTLAYDLDEDNPKTMNRTFACEQEKTFSVMSHSIPNLPTSPGFALGLPTFDEAEMHKAMRDMMSESQISVASSMGILSEQELMDNSLLAEDLYFLLNKKEKPTEEASDASNPPSETEVDLEIAGIVTPEIASISSAEQSAKDSSSSPEPEPKDIGKRPDLNLTFDLGAAATSTPVTPVKTDNMAGEKMASPVKSDAITMKLAAASSVLHKEHSRTDLSLDSDEGKHSDHCDSAGSAGTSVLKRDKSSARNSCGSPESFPHKIRTSADLDELEDCANMSASIELTKTAVAQYASLMKAAHEERVVSEIKRRSQEIMIQEQENKDAEADGEDEGDDEDDDDDDFEDAEDIDDKVNQELILQAGLHLKPRGASSKHSIEVEDIVVDVREGPSKEVSSCCDSAAQSQQTPRVCHEDKAVISPKTPEMVTVGEADSMSPKLLLHCPEVGVGMCEVMSASGITMEEQSGRGETPGITRVKNIVANPFGSMELTDSMFEIVHQESEMIGATILKTLQQEETLSSPDDVMLGSMTSLLKLDSDYDLLGNEVKVEDENQLIADLLAGHDRNERPTSLVSTCSGDTGIVSDSGLVQGVAAGPNPGELVPGDKERPISIISTTSSVDTGYNGDAYEDEPGTLTANTPHHPDLSPTDHPIVDYTTKYYLPPPHEQVAEAGDGQVRGAVEEPLASLVTVPERIVSGMNDANRTYTEPPAQPLNVSYSINEPTPALLSRTYTEQDAAGVQPTQALLNQTHDIKNVEDDRMPVAILSDTYTEVDAQVDAKHPAILSETYTEVDSRGEGQAPSILSETYSEADSRGEGQAPVILSQTYTEIDTEAGTTSKVVSGETDGEETAPVILNQTYADQGAEDKDTAPPILSRTYTDDEGNDVEIAPAILSETYTEHANVKDTLASAILEEPFPGEEVQAQEISPPVLSQIHTDDCTEVDKIAPAILSETHAEPDTDTPTAVNGCADDIPSEVLPHVGVPLSSPHTVEPGSEPLTSASVQPHVASELSPAQTFTPTLDTISTKPLVLSCRVEDRHTASLGDAVMQKSTAALSEAGDIVLDEAAASAAAVADVATLSITPASAAAVADVAPPSPSPPPPSSISPDTHHIEAGSYMDGSLRAEMIVGGAVGVGMVSDEVDVYMRGISPVADNPDLLEGLPMDQPRDLTPSPPYTPMESTPVTVTALVQAHESHTPMDTSEDDVMAVPAKSPDNLAGGPDVMSESTVKDAGKEDVHKDVEMEVNSRDGEPQVMAVPEESIGSEAKKSDSKTDGPTPSKRLTASKPGGRTKGPDGTASETTGSDNKTNRRLSTSKVLKPASEKAEIKKATSRIGSYLKKPVKVKSKEESENENQVIKNVKNLSGSEKKPLSVVLSPGITNDKEDKVSKMDLDPSEDACTVQAYPVIASGDEPPPGKRPPTGKSPPAKGKALMGPPLNIPKPRPVGKVPQSKIGSIPKPATQSRLHGAKPSPRSSVGTTVPRRTSTAASPSASANKPTGLRKLSAPVAPTASKLSLPSRLRKSPSPEPSSRAASRMSSMSDASQADLNTSQSSTMSDGLERSTSSSVSSVKKPGNKTTSTLRQTERRSSSDSQLSLCSDVSTDSYMSSQGPQRLTPRSNTKPTPAPPSSRRSIAGPAPSQSRIATAGSRRTSVPAPSSRLAPRSIPSSLKPPGRPTATSTPVKKRLPTGDGVGRGARSRPTSTAAPVSPPITSMASSTGATPLKRPHQPDVVTAATQALNEEARAATAEVGRLSCEVARLEGVCEARTRQLGGVRSELVQGSRGMEAMLVLIHYLTHELEAFSCPQLKARLHHVRGDLSIAQRQLEELKKQRDQVLCEVKRAKQESERQLKQTDEKYSHEVQSLKLYHEKDTLEKQQEHEESVHALEMKHTEQLQEEQQEHEDILNELQKKHETQLEEITKRFETIRFTLSEKMESMRNECEDLRRREKSIIEGCQRETDYKVQQSLQPYKLLPAEIDSLRAVVELRNQEIHDLRRQKNELLKELEKLPPAREKIKCLQQEKENLQAIVELRGDYEKQLSEKHQVLLRRFERETKANKRLSMDYEELAYRMSTSETGASSPDLMRRSVSHSPTNMDVHPEHHVIMRRKKSPLPPPHSPRSPRSPASFSDFDGTPNGTPCRSPHQNGSNQLSTPPKTNLKRSGTYDLLDQAFDESTTLEDAMHES